MRSLKLAMLGFGNAGKAFAELILSNEERIKSELETEVKVTAIVTGSRGAIVNSNGIDLRRAIDELNRNGSFSHETEGLCSLNVLEVLDYAKYDVAIEITPLDVFSGQPALNHIRKAMKCGKHVITANKGPLAHAARELKSLAKENNVYFLHETTVMDGTPIFNLVEETLPFCRVTEIQGILNTTTNFVLEEMASGKTFKAAMDEGRRRGFVEADSSLDIDGWDAAAKLTALMNVLMDADLKPQDIMRTGIGHITLEEIKAAADKKEVIKLICKGTINDGKPVGSVEPVRLPMNHSYASINGTSSVVTLTTDLMGAVTVTEHDPEIGQTGYGLFSDLLRLIRKTGRL